MTDKDKKLPGKTPPKDFDKLSGKQQLDAQVMILLSIFGKQDNEEDDRLFADILGFNKSGIDNVGGFQAWRSQMRGWKFDVHEVVNMLDYSRFDFKRADKIDVKDIAARHVVLPKTYAEKGLTILNLVGKEGYNNYDIVSGDKKGKPPAHTADGRKLSEMTIKEVMAWQQDRISHPKKGCSSAAGQYQIIKGTLEGLCKQLKLTGNEKFDGNMQDRLGLVLLEQRGYSRFLNGKISEEQFMRNLSKTWAAIPKDQSGVSYYAGVGNNKALVTPATVLDTLRTTKDLYQGSLIAEKTTQKKEEFKQQGKSMTQWGPSVPAPETKVGFNYNPLAPWNMGK
jgi:hypothetical protein